MQFGLLDIEKSQEQFIKLVASQLVYLEAPTLKLHHSIEIYCRCGNVAAILELNENLQREFTIFEAAPQESRGVPSKKPQADYFL